MTTGSNAVVSGTNTSGLYGSTGSVTVQTGAYGNANVAAFLASYTGNLTAGNASVSGNITGGNILSNNYLYANGQPISFAGTYSNANVAAFLPVYSGNISAGNGTITNDLTVGGTIYGTFSGNVSGNLVVPGANTEILFNNAGNAGASSDFRFNSATRVMLLNGTANVANIIVPQTGTINLGNSRIQNVAEPVSGSDAATKDYVDGEFSSDIFSITADGNTFGVAKLDNIIFQGVANQTTVTIPANDTLQIGLANTVSVSGNITANYFIGNGSQLTGLAATYGNANVATFLAAFGSNTISTSGNITSGNILTGGTVSATGNVSGNYFIGNGSLLTGITTTYGNANVANYLPTYSGNVGSLSTPITLTGNDANIIGSTVRMTGNSVTISAGVTTLDLQAQQTIRLRSPLGTTANVLIESLNTSVTGNIIHTNGLLSTTGNVTAANVLTGGAVSATGNVTGNYIIGDGSLLTNLPGGSYGNANVANYLPTFTGNVGAGNLVMTSTSGVAYVNTITGLAGAAITIAPDGTNDVHLDADTVRIGDNNTDATLTTHGTGDLILTTHQGSAAEGNIILRDGASGNIDIQTNGSGVVNITGTAGLRVADGISAVGNITGGNLVTTGQISATGNITGNYFLGNGSQLTGISGTYSNANVSAFLAAFGSNTISTSGNITSGNIIANGQFLTNLPGANVTGTVANATYALSANSATFAGTVTTAAQPNITSVGTLTSVSVTGNVQAGNLRTTGVVSATGNITGNYYFGNGSQLTGISVSVAGSNTEVQFNDSGAFGASANLTFNKATQELQTDRINLVGGNINFDPPSGTSGPRYITLTTDAGTPFYGVRIGPGATAANIPGAARDTVAIGRNAGNDNQGDNAIAIGMAAGNLNSGAYTVAIGTVAGGNAQGIGAIAIGDEAGRENQGSSAIAIGEDAGYTSQGTKSIAIGQLAGNVSQGNSAIAIGYGAGQNNQPANSIVINANGTTALNASNSGFYVMPVRNDTGNTTNAVYYNTTTKELTYTTSGSGGYGNANVATFLAAYGSNTFSSTGNVTTTGVLTASNTAANLQVANTIFLNQQIQTLGNRNIGAISNTVADPGRIVIGQGYAGNLSPGVDQNSQGRGARLLIADAMDQADTGFRSSGLAIQNYLTLTANVGSANSNTRVAAATNQVLVGGGASGNSWNSGSSLALAATQNTINLGGTGNLSAVGNVVARGVAATVSTAIVNAGSVANSATAHISALLTGSTTGNIGNAIGYGVSFSSFGTGSYTGNVYGYYMPDFSSNFGYNTSNVARGASNYYFLRNDDNAAQNKMGAMRLWHDFRYTHTTTTGAITVDKNNGQTQYIAVTGNITGITLSNFVTTASDGTTTDQEMDTVTLWLRQDATGRTITMPTGANYFYESGTTTVPTTANSVSKIEFTAIDNAGTTQYLIDISAAYTST